MKPDWKTAPVWANWLAMDDNGIWFWFEQIPHISKKKPIWISINGEYTFAGRFETVTEKWKESLEKLPEVNNV